MTGILAYYIFIWGIETIYKRLEEANLDKSIGFIKKIIGSNKISLELRKK